MLRQGVFLDVHTLMQNWTPWPAGRPECFISSPSLVFAFGHYLDNRQRVVASWKSVCLLMYPLLCLTITLPSYPAPFKHPNYVWEICSLMDLALSGQHPENSRLRLLCNRDTGGWTWLASQSSAPESLVCKQATWGDKPGGGHVGGLGGSRGIQQPGAASPGGSSVFTGNSNSFNFLVRPVQIHNLGWFLLCLDSSPQSRELPNFLIIKSFSKYSAIMGLCCFQLKIWTERATSISKGGTGTNQC